MITAALKNLFLANHQQVLSGEGNLAVLWVFLGLAATAGWLIFSELPGRQTVLVTLAGWLVVGALVILV